MTLPKPGVHDSRLQKLYTQLKEVTAQIKQEEAHHHRRQRQQELERVLVYGRLVRLVGLDGTAPALLLGLLWEGMFQMTDGAVCQRWQTTGTEILAGDRRLRRTVQRLWPSSHPTEGETTATAGALACSPPLHADHVCVATNGEGCRE
jgi:hypothetical protein